MPPSYGNVSIRYNLISRYTGIFWFCFTTSYNPFHNTCMYIYRSLVIFCHIYYEFYRLTVLLCRSQWPRGLRRRSAAARLLRSSVRIPPGAWMFVCCDCCDGCVWSGRGLWDETITRPEESYRMWCLVVWSRNLKNEESMTHVGSQRHRENKKFFCVGQFGTAISVFSVSVWWKFSKFHRATLFAYFQMYLESMIDFTSNFNSSEMLRHVER
jgi:hypothetical protein